MDTRSLSPAPIHLNESEEQHWAADFPQENWIRYHLNVNRLVQQLRVPLPQENKPDAFRYLTLIEYNQLDPKIKSEMQTFLNEQPEEHDLQACKACHEEYKQLHAAVKEHWITASQNDLNIALKSYDRHKLMVDILFRESQAVAANEALESNSPLVEVVLDNDEPSPSFLESSELSPKTEANHSNRNPRNSLPNTPGYFASFTQNYPWSWAFIKFILLPAAAAALIVFTGGTAAMGIALSDFATFFIMAAGLSLVGNLFLELSKSLYNYFTAEAQPSDPLSNNEVPLSDSPFVEPELDNKKEMGNELENPENIQALKEAVDVLNALHTTLDAQKEVSDDELRQKGVSSTVQDRDENSPRSSVSSRKSSVGDKRVPAPDFSHSAQGQSFFQDDSYSSDEAFSPQSAPSEQGSPVFFPRSASLPGSISHPINTSSLLRPRAYSDPMPVTLAQAAELQAAASRAQQQPIGDGSGSDYSDDFDDISSEEKNAVTPEIKAEEVSVQADQPTAIKPPSPTSPHKTNAFLAKQMQQAVNLRVISSDTDNKANREEKQDDSAAAPKLGVSEKALSHVVGALLAWKTKPVEQKRAALLSYSEAVHKKKAASARLINPSEVSQGNNESVAGHISGVVHARQLSSSTGGILANLHTGTRGMNIITDTAPLLDDQIAAQENSAATSATTNNNVLPLASVNADVNNSQQAEKEEKQQIKRNSI